MATKTKKTPLTERELLVMAAVFARTNMGQSRPTRDEVQRALHHESVNLSSAVMWFCEEFMESNEDQDTFENEARGWVKSLKKDGREKIQEIWPEMAALVW